MLRLALWSLSIEIPQNGQQCVLIAKVFFTIPPQLEQLWLVPCGATFANRIPAFAALYSSFWKKEFQEESDMDLAR
jgi:hypothetical protein